MANPLSAFFAPKSVAIIGASSNPNKLSFGIIRNLTSYGYQGAIYPVNPKAEDILGLTCYPEVESIPAEVDLAVSVVAAGQTPGVLEACGRKGIRAATVISGGFREVGAEGAALERQCLEIARRYGMRLIGPNCVGTMDLHSGLNTTFVAGVPDRGHIGFLSQSGAICGGIVDYVRGKQVGFSAFASMGNEADVSETDLIEYLAEDPNTRVIACYVEAIQDGQRFVEVAGRVSQIKPIVVLKAGRSEAGAKAVSSHTGSIAGSMDAYRAGFKQGGVVTVDTVSELFDVSLALASQPFPAGTRTALLTNSGGPAALASDSLAPNGLSLAELSQETQTALRTFLNPSAQVSNPVDMLGGAEPADYRRALEILFRDPGVDCVVPILVPQALIRPEEVARAIAEVSVGSAKPLAACFMGDEAVKEARKVLHGAGIPMYTFPESIGKSLGALLKTRQFRESAIGAKIRSFAGDRQVVEQILAENAGQPALGELGTRPLLEAYGIPVAEGRFVANAEEAADAAKSIGGPLVMKIVSPDILHKSDSGGIRLNIHTPEAARTAYEQMMAEVARHLPEARLEGALVEQMAPEGTEVIIGMRRDPSFGPLIMFGLGGVYVELFGDVSFRIAPVSVDEAREMVFETRAGRLLSGYRGQQPGDVEGLVACIQRFSQLCLDFTQIEEAEINPLRVLSGKQGVVALDGRVILAG